MRPRKQHVRIEVKIPRDDDLTQRMEDAGMSLLTYQVRWGAYRLQITDTDLDDNEELLRELIRRARDAYGTTR